MMVRVKDGVYIMRGKPGTTMHLTPHLKRSDDGIYADDGRLYDV